jgi:Fe-S cluster biogenesis protein NfuA
MLQQIAFIPQHQFHVLINFSGEDERIVAVLPNDAGNFRVVDQGKTIAELNLDKGCCTCYKGKLKKNVMAQLEHQIKNHYA